MNLTVTFAESDVILAIQVSAEMTVADLRAYAMEEAGYTDDTGSTLSFNNKQLADSVTLTDAGLRDNDMVLLRINRASSGVGSGSGDPGSGNYSGNYGSGFGSPGDNGDATLTMQIEAARQQILYDPQLFAQLSQQSPELADALHDPAKFQSAYRKLQKQQMKVKAENEEIDRNFRLAMEEMPEAFTTVTMLFANIEVNGVPVKAFVDSGAQTTIMSPECAERCHLSHLIDKRHRGMAYGVGQATILGRIHMAPIKIGSSYFACSMTVIEGTNMEFLLGLDMLRHHQATLDLKHNRLIMGKEELPFLTENEIPKNLVGPPATGPTVMPKPVARLPRGATSGAEASKNAGAPSSDPRKELLQAQLQQAQLQQAQRQGQTQWQGQGQGQQLGQVPATGQAQRPDQAQWRNPAQQTGQAPATGQFAQAGPTQASEPSGGFDKTVVSNLMSLGFSRPEVMRALTEASGNADAAASLLFGE